MVKFTTPTVNTKLYLVVRFGSFIEGMDILAQMPLAKPLTLAPPNSLDMAPKLTKEL